MAGVLILLAAASRTWAGDPRPLPPAVQGKWVAVAIEFGGQRPPADVVRQYKVTVGAGTIVLAPLNFADGKFNVVGEPLELRCEQDPKAGPGAIDLLGKDGDEEFRMLGLYAVDARQLKLCWQYDGKARPAEFRARAEPAQMLLVLERANP